MTTPCKPVRFFAPLLLLLLAVTGRAEGGVTSLVLQSDPGDWVGQGQTLVLNEGSGSFQAWGSPSNITIAFNGPGHWWYLSFGTSDDEPLVVGPYENAVRHMLRGGGHPGLDVSGDGRGCNMLSGRFDVREVSLGAGGEVVAFWATFEQHCESVGPALRGEIRYNANVPLQLSGPTAITVRENQSTSFAVAAADAQGRHVTLTATVPIGASFVDLGQNTGNFDWTPLPSQVGSHVVIVQGTNGVDTEMLWIRITVTPTPPPNDEIDEAVVVPSVPFTYSQQTVAATLAADDPFCGSSTNTVWFAFTPSATHRIEFNTGGSNYYTSQSAYTGARGNLSRVACNEGWPARIRFDAVAGMTYYVMVGGPAWSVPSGGALQLNVVDAPPPFSMGFTVEQFSHVDPSTGIVTVLGTVTCSSPSFVFISGQIRQERAGRAANAFYGAYVPCDGTTPFEAGATYLSNPALFHGRSVMLFSGGRADVSGTAQAFDPVEGTWITRSLAETIQLRGAKNP
jgi:hypothetical protein